MLSLAFGVRLSHSGCAWNVSGLVDRDIHRNPHVAYGREERLRCIQTGTPVHGINGVGRRKVPRPAVAALRMTSCWVIILKSRSRFSVVTRFDGL
jgi:hypothetical protein